MLFERKMTRKMLSLVLTAIGAVFLLRELIRGRFGDAVVAFLTGVFHLDYSDALYIYEATFRDHLDGIIAYAVHRVTSGKCEGIVNLIKTVRRAAYGFKDTDYFFLRLLDASRGYPA